MKTRIKARIEGSERRGASLVIVTFVFTSLAALSLAILATSNRASSEIRSRRIRLDALYAAEAGMSHSMYLRTNGLVGDIASSTAPVSYGGADYWVDVQWWDDTASPPAWGDVDTGASISRMVAFGVDGGAGTRIDSTVQAHINTIYAWGAFGDEGLTMDSNAMVDSYDSGAGLYETQEVNGSGSDTYALSNGSVGSNGDIGLDQNSYVHGDATPGPGGTVSFAGSSSASGSTVPALEPMILPPLEVPAIASAGNRTVTGAETLAPGDYAYDDFRISTGSTLQVTGPARLVLGSAVLNSNSSLIVDATNGRVEIYVIDDFVLDSNTLIASTTFDPADVNVFLESDNVIDPDLNVDLDNVEFDSNSRMYSTIYAPNAAITIDSNFELFGSLVARSVNLSSNSEVHFDEALLTNTALAEVTYEIIGWQVMPFRPEN